MLLPASDPLEVVNPRSDQHDHGLLKNIGTKSDVARLKMCSNTRNLEQGKTIHTEALKSGNISCIYVATALVKMYANCRRMSEARKVFDCIREPDVVSWTILILGYAENGESGTALDLFAMMKSRGCAPNSITIVAALKACTAIALEQDGNRRAECRERGQQIHSEIGCHLNLHVQNTLIHMYGKCKIMIEARQVFSGIRCPNVVSWNALILGYAENGEGVTALEMFATMKSQGCSPNSITFVAAVKSCISLVHEHDVSSKLKCRKHGAKIHSEIGCHFDAHVRNTLVVMYAKCESMLEAYHMFKSIKHPDVVSWSALILGYAATGKGVTALELFARMKSQGCIPDSLTFVAALKACASLAVDQDESGIAECRERGKQIHSEIGCHLNPYVECALIDMYSKGGRMQEARQIFDDMKHTNLVSWNALILGYAGNGEGVIAIDLFRRMKSHECVPNSITYVAVLKACCSLGALEAGSKIHGEINTSGIEFNEMLVTCLVDFYAKCGNLGEAQKVFDSHPHTRELKTWTALLAGYGRLGDSKAVFGLFKGMQDAGFQPNSVTYLCVLTCCSHGGLVEKANELFYSMSVSGVTPRVEHYNCMVDIFARSNELDNAVTWLRGMPCKPNAVTWMTVLAACRKWKNVMIGRLAFKSFASLDATNAAAYVLMAHIYGSRGLWEEQEMVLRMLKALKVGWRDLS